MENFYSYDKFGKDTRNLKWELLIAKVLGSLNNRGLYQIIPVTLNGDSKSRQIKYKRP